MLVVTVQGKVQRYEGTSPCLDQSKYEDYQHESTGICLGQCRSSRLEDEWNSLQYEEVEDRNGDGGPKTWIIVVP